MMKSLAGSDWGQDKEMLLITYKAIGRSLLEYGTLSGVLKLASLIGANYKLFKTKPSELLLVA